MDPNRRELIEAELRNARERLRAARSLLDAGLTPDTISRAYYATFHAAKAALALHGLHAESHVGLRTLFGLNLVDQQIVDRRLGKILVELSERRESADHDVWSAMDTEDARKAVQDASEFLESIEKLVGTTRSSR